MKCNLKTMISTAAVLLAALTVAYFAFPAAQALVLASAPILLALICPVSMIAMMWSMRGRDTSAPAATPNAHDSTPAHRINDVVQEG